MPTSETPAVKDVRPELSVAERVMAEGDNALNMAEWAVEPKPPAAPKQDAEASAEWVVEDPSAPRPELRAGLDDPAPHGNGVGRTGGQGSFARVCAIAADPAHPRRACDRGSVSRECVIAIDGRARHPLALASG